MRSAILLTALFVWAAVSANAQDAPAGQQPASASPPASALQPPASELLKFKIPDEQFQPTAVPDWIWDATLYCFAGGEAIDRSAADGVQVVNGGGPWAYYPLKKDDPNSGPPADQVAGIKDTMERVRKNGQRYVAGNAPFAPRALVKMHPEWLIHEQDSTEVETKALAPLESNPEAQFGMCLLSSPWRDYYIDCLGEILRDFGMDGFSFDGNYHAALCFCPSCKTQFRADTGRDLPKKVDLNDIEYRVYLEWADHRLETWYQALLARMHSIKPDSVLNSWTINAGRYGHFLHSPHGMSRRLNLLFASPMQEWWLDETNFGGTVAPAFGAAYIRAVTGNRVAMCEPYLMSRGNPYGTDSFPAHEVMTRSLQVLTHGSMVGLSYGWGGHYETVSEVFKEVRRRAPYLTRADKEPWAALLYGEQTKQFYGLTQIADRYLPHPFGAFRATMEEHLPTTLITEWDLTPEALAKYKVLVLPNTACLSDRQAQAVRDYVASGGGLVASCDASLFDELGRSRGNFALAELFGVDYAGKVEQAAGGERAALDPNFAIALNEAYWKERTGIGAFALRGEGIADSPLAHDAALTKLVPGGSVVFKGSTVRVSEPRAASAQVAARITPENSSDRLPAVVMNTFGKGRVVYLAAGLDGAYFTYWYPYQRRAFVTALQWAAGAEPEVKVAAPMCIQAGFFRQQTADGPRVVVHLFNEINSTSNHGRPDIEVPLREEAVPVGGIRVTLPEAWKIKRVHWEPEGRELTPAEGPAGAGRTYEIPPVEIHGMLVADLEHP